MSLFDTITQNSLQETIALVEQQGPSIVNSECGPESIKPLLLAARLAHAEIVQYLLRVQGIDVCGAVDSDGQNVLHNAVSGVVHRGGYEMQDDAESTQEVLKLLCLHNNGELLNSTVKKKKEQQQQQHLITPLSIAIDGGSVDTSLFLLSQPHICTSLAIHHQEQLAVLASSSRSKKRGTTPLPLLYRATPFAPIVEALLKHYRGDLHTHEHQASCTCTAEFGAEVLEMRSAATLALAVELNAVGTARLLVGWGGVDPRAIYVGSKGGSSSSRRGSGSGKRRVIDLAQELNRREILDVMDPPRPFHSMGALGTLGLCDVFSAFPRGAVAIQELRDAFTPTSIVNDAAVAAACGLTAEQRKAVQEVAEAVAFGTDSVAEAEDSSSSSIAPLLKYVRALASSSHSAEARTLWVSCQEHFSDAAVHEAVSITATACFLSRFCAGHGIRPTELKSERETAEARRVDDAAWGSSAASSSSSSQPLSHIGLLREARIVPDNFSSPDHFNSRGGIPTEAQIDAPRLEQERLNEDAEALQRQWQDNQKLLAEVVATEALQRREVERRLIVIQSEEAARLLVTNEAMHNELMLLTGAMSAFASLQKEHDAMLVSQQRSEEEKKKKDESTTENQPSKTESLSSSPPSPGGNNNGDGGLRLLRNMFIVETMMRNEAERRGRHMLLEKTIRLDMAVEFRPVVVPRELMMHSPLLVSRDESGAVSMAQAETSTIINRATQQADEAMKGQEMMMGRRGSASLPFKPRPPSAPASAARTPTPASEEGAADAAAADKKVRGEYTPFSAQRRPPRLVGSQLVSPNYAPSPATQQQQQQQQRSIEQNNSPAPITARQLHGESDYADYTELFKGDAITEAALRIQYEAIDTNGSGKIDKNEFCKFYLEELEDYGLPLSEWDFEQLWWKVVGKGETHLGFNQFAVFMLKRSKF